MAEFDSIIDVRAPGEFQDDHLPRAINLPVLSDDERREVGTLYKQVSPFAARKLGAAKVARNIADHIESQLQQQPKSWRPLVYCWRGGQRSAAFAHVLREIGWDAHRLQGGYKSWRRHIVEQLEILPSRHRFAVITGPTGSGKSRLLQALAQHGAQTLHLEQLAVHKGSVLGASPTEAQPSQKSFESQLFGALSAFDPQQTVYVEAESRKIGRLQLPNALLHAIHTAPCLRIETSLSARIEFLLHDYADAIARPHWLIERLGFLKGLQSNDTLDRWRSFVERGEFPTLVAELLTLHYDPLYRRSQTHHFDSLAHAERLNIDRLTMEAFDRLARQIVAGSI